MKIQAVSGKTFHLPGDDIDTDRIIPARFLRCVTFDGLGDHVFEDDRKQLKGRHPFDDPKNKGSEILVADANFGCGSSREHAVAALQRWGIKAIIAKSLAAIFRGNATANGLVCVDVTENDHQRLLSFLRTNDDTNICVDLELRLVHMGKIEHPSVKCEVPSADRDMLINGTWDTTTTLLKAGDLIEATASRLPYMQCNLV